MTVRRLALLATLAVLAPTGRASADEGWDKFTLLDLKIGMPVQQTGFACAKQRGKDIEDTHCVKFTDPRCNGKPGAIGFKEYRDHAPPGCYLDYSSNATYLDDSLMQTPNTGDSTDRRPIKKPLTNLHLIGTRSKPSKIYRMYYMVPPDDLAEDSKLYKALAAKYGEPVERHSGKVRWKLDNTKLEAYCIAERNCEITVEDLKFEDNERRKQEEADAKAKRKAAPDAPPL